jgi:hypothetical protein
MKFIYTAILSILCFQTSYATDFKYEYIQTDNMGNSHHPTIRITYHGDKPIKQLWCAPEGSASFMNINVNKNETLVLVEKFKPYSISCYSSALSSEHDALHTIGEIKTMPSLKDMAISAAQEGKDKGAITNQNIQQIPQELREKLR